MSEKLGTYVELEDAAVQLSIDDGLLDEDPRLRRRLQILVGAAEDWAEEYTGRSLSQLMMIDSPADSNVTATPDPSGWKWRTGDPKPDFYTCAPVDWLPEQWHYWHNFNEAPTTGQRPGIRRRDIYAGMLMYMEQLYDRNVDNMDLLKTRAEDLLWPHRLNLGV